MNPCDSKIKDSRRNIEKIGAIRLSPGVLNQTEHKIANRERKTNADKILFSIKRDTMKQINTDNKV